MIIKPQIFIIYEPGMYGTFLATLFARHKILSNEYTINDFISDEYNYNAHSSGYNDRLKKFHTKKDVDDLLTKSEDDLKLFFTTLHHYELSIHRVSSYFTIKINFEKLFSNYVRIILIPKKTRIRNYAERWFFSTRRTYEEEYWIKNLKKKRLEEIPEYFLRKMSIEEKEKYLNAHLDFFNQNYKKTQSTDLIFDPDDFANQNKLKELVNGACKILNIETIELPDNEIKKFININKQFLS